MTTYGANLTLIEAEISTLMRALELMIKHCKEKRANGEGIKYGYYIKPAQDILDRLSLSLYQTSGNNFFDDSEEEPSITIQSPRIR